MRRAWRDCLPRRRRCAPEARSRRSAARACAHSPATRGASARGPSSRRRGSGGACGPRLPALAGDPWRLGARAELEEAVERARAAAAAPHPLQGARDCVVLADAEDLLAGDDLLCAWADAMAGDDGVTLAIDAT